MITTKESYINGFLILKNMPFEPQIKINSEEIKLPVTIAPDASTKEISNIKKKVSLKELRKIVNSYDFIIFQTLKNKQQQVINNPDNYEDYQFINVSKEFDDTDGLFIQD